MNINKYIDVFFFFFSSGINIEDSINQRRVKTCWKITSESPDSMQVVSSCQQVDQYLARFPVSFMHALYDYVSKAAQHST